MLCNNHEHSTIFAFAAILEKTFIDFFSNLNLPPEEDVITKKTDEKMPSKSFKLFYSSKKTVSLNPPPPHITLSLKNILRIMA